MVDVPLNQTKPINCYFYVWVTNIVCRLLLWILSLLVFWSDFYHHHHHLSFHCWSFLLSTINLHSMIASFYWPVSPMILNHSVGFNLICFNFIYLLINILCCNDNLSKNRCIRLVGVVFYDISIFVGYLMPSPVYHIIFTNPSARAGYDTRSIF